MEALRIHFIPSWHLPWTVKAFTVSCVGLFVATFMVVITRPTGRPPVDFYNANRGQLGLFTVGFFTLADPVLFGFYAAAYAAFTKLSGRQAKRPLALLHFGSMIITSVFVLWLARTGIDLVSPDWQTQWGPLYRSEVVGFTLSKVVFWIAQIIFLVNLAWSCFDPREEAR